MRKPLALALGVALVVGSAAVAWVKLRPAPVAPPAPEKSYEQIERPEYEKWMQDLGYTE